MPQKFKHTAVLLFEPGHTRQIQKLFLKAIGLKVNVVNQAAVRAFAGASLSRTKTDKVDAELIARFCLP